MWWFSNKINEALQKEYISVDSGRYIEFFSQEERALFEKYLELWERNWWSYSEEPQKHTIYDRHIITTVKILWTNCEWKVSRYIYWHTMMDDSWYYNYINFDAIKNREELIKYIFKVAKDYQDSQDKIKREEEEAEEERKRIQQDNKERLELAETYIKRLSELNWNSWEFNPQFKILREIESIWELNTKLLDNWKENVEKIHSLRKEFYSI